MTQVINIYGGPGSGKSTTAAALFSELKMLGQSVELVREITKEWAWLGRKVSNTDEFYIFGEQSRRESELLGKVDIVVTDRPLWLSAVYARMYAPSSVVYAMLQACDAWAELLENRGHTQKHFLLRRSGGYEQAGRFETQELASKIDKLCWELLTDEVEFDLVEEKKGTPAAKRILEYLSGQVYSL